MAADRPVILAIDPGPVRSGWIELCDGGLPSSHGIDGNDDLLEKLRERSWPLDPDLGQLVIEQVASYGMPVGVEVFETVYWSGRFAESVYPAIPVDRITRKAVVTHLCGSARAKDPNVRQALIDRFGGPSAIGTKKAPGPLYGIHGDLWAALAVAVAWSDLHGGER